MNLRILCSSALLLAAGTAFSAELDYALTGGLAYSDNVERVPDGLERSSTAAALGLEVHGERPTGRLRYDIATDIAYHEYFNRGIDSEVFGHAAFIGSYDMVSEFLGWNASLAYEQLRADGFRPLAPGNTEALISFSTGPTLRARFSEVMRGELDARYALVSYGDRPFDNETVGARMMLTRRPNPGSMLGIGASYDEVTYTSNSAPSGLDFDRQEYIARFELTGVRTAFDLETGYATVDGDTFKDSGAMLRAHLERRMTPTLTGFLNAVREYPTSEDFTRTADYLSGVAGDLGRSELDSGPRQSTSFDGGVRIERPRVGAELAYARREEKSLVGVSSERNYDEFRASVSRRFTPRMRGTLLGTLTKEDFSGFTSSADERTIAAQLEVAFGRSLGVDFRIDHRKRDGTAGYSEFGGGVFLRYAPAARGETAR
jgi:hypothetical protein